MRSLFEVFATVCAFGSVVASRAVEVFERRDNVTLPAPVVAVPSQHW